MNKKILLALGVLVGLSSASASTDLIQIDPYFKTILIGEVTKKNPATKMHFKKDLNNGCEVGAYEVDLNVNDEDGDETLEVLICKDESNKKVISFDIKTASNRVLVKGRGTGLISILPVTEASEYRTLRFKTKISKSEETDKRCGFIESNWVKDPLLGVYLATEKGARVEVAGACEPYYELPDHLSGINTIGLTNEEWEERVKQETVRKNQIFAPYEQALTDYVSEWVQRVNNEIASSELFRIVPCCSFL